MDEDEKFRAECAERLRELLRCQWRAQYGDPLRACKELMSFPKGPQRDAARLRLGLKGPLIERLARVCKLADLV